MASQSSVWYAFQIAWRIFWALHVNDRDMLTVMLRASTGERRAR